MARLITLPSATLQLLDQNGPAVGPFWTLIRWYCHGLVAHTPRFVSEGAGESDASITYPARKPNFVSNFPETVLLVVCANFVVSQSKTNETDNNGHFSDVIVR